MEDVLIPGVPDQVVARIDENAHRLGLTRTEYLRRLLLRTAAPAAGDVSADALGRFADVAADLADDEVMGRAWS